MNFYITTENEDKLRNTFMNFRFFHLVSVPNILKNMGVNYNNLSEYQKWILNNNITREIKNCLNKTSVCAIIYQNPWVNYESIKNLHEFLDPNNKISKIILIDDKDTYKNENLWQFFSEVMFFPKVKKIKVEDLENIKCYSYKELVKYGYKD